jgi:hypothetical protein
VVATAAAALLQTDAGAARAAALATLETKRWLQLCRQCSGYAWLTSLLACSRDDVGAQYHDRAGREAQLHQQRCCVPPGVIDVLALAATRYDDGCAVHTELLESVYRALTGVVSTIARQQPLRSGALVDCTLCLANHHNKKNSRALLHFPESKTQLISARTSWIY